MSEVDLGRLVAHLNQTLAVRDFDEGAINGLQVSGKKKVRKIAFAVDGVLETFEKAVADGADMVLVHHGIYWGFQYALRGPDYQRIKTLMDAECSLYAAHLPMDAHADLGHNVNLLRALDVEPDSLEPFGSYKGNTIGFTARIAQTRREDLTAQLTAILGGPVKLLDFGPDKVRTVACITGAGANFGWVREAKIAGVHYFITGEADHPIFHFAKENGMTIALGGHYRTEVFGLHALRRHLEATFGIETFFIDCPTGM